MTPAILKARLSTLRSRPEAAEARDAWRRITEPTTTSQPTAAAHAGDNGNGSREPERIR